MSIEATGSDENVEKYIEAGGKAILFQQPWNKLRHFAAINNRITHVVNSLYDPKYESA
jgi:hypothetical protein